MEICPYFLVLPLITDEISFAKKIFLRAEINMFRLKYILPCVHYIISCNNYLTFILIVQRSINDDKLIYRHLLAKCLPPHSLPSSALKTVIITIFRCSLQSPPVKCAFRIFSSLFWSPHTRMRTIEQLQVGLYFTQRFVK